MNVSSDPNKSPEKSVAVQKNKKYVSQADVPGVSLEKALRVAVALEENFAKQPAKPLHIASAIKMQPGSGPFRQLCGASIAYGLTLGGAYADAIALTSLGKRAVAPTQENDDMQAKREAILTPKVVRDFLTKYNNSKLPTNEIAYNVLEEMGVPRERTKTTYEIILENAETVGFITNIGDRLYVDLSYVSTEPKQNESDSEDVPLSTMETDDMQQGPEQPTAVLDIKDAPSTSANTVSLDNKTRRVFITHGKNKKFIEPIKQLLIFGEMEPVVAAEQQTVSQPIPDKVMEAMRSCGAAIIHVDIEKVATDTDGTSTDVLNPNVLIEIGAAIALYNRRFIILVQEGVKLPSNLQGLYEVRYTGDDLGSETTIKLLQAIRDIKSRPFEN